MDQCISCLTVTKGRLALLRESIACYRLQTYPNKELLVVTDAEPGVLAALEEYIGGLNTPDVRIAVVNEPGCSLGRLRNISVALASGPIVCQWDDDDLFHPDRLTLQYTSMCAAHADACFLTEQLQLFTANQRLYWCRWDRSRDPSSWPPCIPGTLMAKKALLSKYQETGPASRLGEDTALLSQLNKEIRLVTLQGYAWLYIRRSHGQNSWNEEHHRNIVRATGLTAKEVAAQGQQMLAELSKYPALRQAMSICGYDGSLAIKYEPESSAVATNDRPVAWSTTPRRIGQTSGGGVG